MAIHGEITAPPDKSISHRAFMLGGLAKGTTTITNALESEDVKSTMGAMRALGIDIRKEGDRYLVKGAKPAEPSTVIDAGNSGTTARLLCGILAGIDGVTAVTGDSSLVKRPMARVIKPLEAMGVKFMARKGGFLPMAVRGGRLTGISYGMEVASAQVKSALLLAGLTAEGETKVTESTRSRDHTERMLRFFGVKIHQDETSVSISGGQELEARDIIVPGDPSSAAFPVVWAAAVPGSELMVRNVCLNPTRTGFLNVLERMGADIGRVNIREMAGEEVGDLMIRGSELRATVIEGKEIPSLIDEIPILAVAASLASGTTVIRDAKELRVKETDRITATLQGFAALNAGVEELPDGMVINGPLKFSSGSVRTFADHRVAMSFHILSRAAGINVNLDNRECVAISYPGFFEAMETLA
jgi:3-phosphoshikimate 1-carboxyvinyltransferase